MQECAGERVEGLPAVVGKAFAAPQGRAALIVLVVLPCSIHILVIGTRGAGCALVYGIVVAVMASQGPGTPYRK